MIAVIWASWTLVSDSLYVQFGARGFWVMAALCASALPLARKL
jgi:hypothetical protein